MFCCWFWRWRKRPQVNECRWLLGSQKRLGTGFPPEAQRKDTALPRPFWTPDIREIRKQQMCDIWDHCTWSNFLQQQEETVTLTFATVSVASGLSGQTFYSCKPSATMEESADQKDFVASNHCDFWKLSAVIGIWYHRTDNLLAFRIKWYYKEK